MENGPNLGLFEKAPNKLKCYGLGRTESKRYSLAWFGLGLGPIGLDIVVEGFNVTKSPKSS